MHPPPGEDGPAVLRRTNVESGCCGGWQTDPSPLFPNRAQIHSITVGWSLNLSVRSVPLFSRPGTSTGVPRPSTTGSPPASGGADFALPIDVSRHGCRFSLKHACLGSGEVKCWRTRNIARDSRRLMCRDFEGGHVPPNALP